MRILVTRLSALGDVALLVPVLKKFTDQHPEHELMVVSRSFLKPLFDPLPVRFYAAEVYGKHKGLKGLWRLHKELRKAFDPELVLDMHAVMRTHVLGNFFKLQGIPLFQIKKGRPEKKALTAKTNKVFTPLKHSAVRYAEVFASAGFDFHFDPLHPPLMQYSSPLADSFVQEEIALLDKTIGIAPFAFHQGKMWPKEKMQKAIEALAEEGYQLILFGGPEDSDELSVWAYTLPNTQSVAGRFDLATELAIIQQLPVMLTMDSSNMHFAALVGTPVVSIWGSTHPYAGFAPLGKNENTYVQVPHSELSCRPCSVFGNKPCWRGDYACLEHISPQGVVQNLVKNIA
jgi:ADP-heptose:LPS heptosyltransferase